ncbi:LL-diaminopimelate aminotransferase [Oscillospiraceae bacterium]|nr:LL-diaminopimelate aminotransferase [Oscillospiraceae bacterium]
MKMNHHFSELPGSYLFSEVAKRVAAHRAARPEQGIISLGIGDVTRPLCRPVVAALAEACFEQGRAETFHGYGEEQGYLFLRQAIAGHYAGLGVRVEPEDLFISDGAKSDLAGLTELFSPGCTVLLQDPVYPAYRDASLLAGRRVEYLDAGRENGFLPLPGPGCRADLVYLCSPGNPTGAVYSREQLAAWVAWANAQGAVLVFDAAYEAFIADPGLPHSIYAVPGAETCAIEVCSFSKTAGFTGTRCGYTAVPRTLQREGLNLHDMWLRRQTTKTNGVSYPVQRGAAAVFTAEGQAACRENIALYRRNAQCLAACLEELGIWFCGGENSPYLWLECPDGMDSWQFFDHLLQGAGVVGTPGSGFGKNGEGYFRLTAFGAEADTAEAVRRILRLYGR